MNPKQPPKKDANPLQWIWYYSKLTFASFFVYLAPLALGMTLPGETVSDPQGWIVGFWRYPFVVAIVCLQILCFIVGWFMMSRRFTKIVAALYIVLMSFQLARNYFFGVEANWWLCIILFVVCFLLTVTRDGHAALVQQSRRRSD